MGLRAGRSRLLASLDPSMLSLGVGGTCLGAELVISHPSRAGSSWRGLGVSSGYTKREGALDQTVTGCQETHGIGGYLVCVLFSLLQIHWAGRIGCGDLWGRWSHDRCGRRTSRVCFLPVEVGCSPRWGPQSAAGEAELGTAAKPPDLAPE